MCGFCVGSVVSSFNAVGNKEGDLGDICTRGEFVRG